MPVAGALVVPTVANGAPSYRIVTGTFDGGTVVGDRYFVYETGFRGAFSIGIFDMKTARTARLDLPSDCVSQMNGDSPSYAFGSAIIVNCRRDQRGSTNALIEIPTGVRPALPRVYGYSVRGVGSQWVWDGGSGYANRITGLATTVPRTAAEERARIHRDLDDPDLGPITLCAPFDHQLARSREQQRGQRVLFQERRGVVVGTCGSGRERTFQDRGAQSDLSLAGDMAVWTGHYKALSPSDADVFSSPHCARSISSLDLRRGTLTTWRPPSIRGRRCGGPALHTRYGIIYMLHWTTVATDTDLAGTYRFRYRAIFIPRHS